ncbi:hypothetical protein FNF28_04981 [Cafeteria roenbergensis]|uniref:ATP-dependent helicase C-terminal domain-containing protein n=1 Tax=Cafeteria roenbergensis TaxID=33653 RepID=A0A5A8D7Z1_CAFRO|nr:hypothetical protein FNF28_04981 [Cafeteria roenbergensis]
MPADAQTGAVLFAVFRGKVSEGIDFADDAARGVILVGTPYAALDAPDGLNALLTAASAGTESMVRELLDRGADVEVTNVAGETALSVAANDSVARVLERADCFQRWHRRASLALWRRACGWR